MEENKTTDGHDAPLDSLVNQIEQLRETNRRLNRRVQLIEGEKRYRLAWLDGYEEGSSQAYDRAKKDFDKRMADYKHSTRIEMSKLRDQAKPQED